METKDTFYKIVADEISVGRLDAPRWTKAIAESNGTADAARRLYIRARVAELEAAEHTEKVARKRQAKQERRHSADARYARGFPVAAIFSILFAYLWLIDDPSGNYPYSPLMVWLIPFFGVIAARGLIALRRRTKTRV
jgi:hypothetical protein